MLVVSDHGGGSLDGVVNLNAWLAQQGYLPTLRPTYGGNETKRRVGHRLFELRPHAPEDLRYSVKQRLPWLRERAYRLRAPTVVDWSRTQAFSYGIFGNIVINVRGRERYGIVEPGSRVRARARRARRALLELRSPEGEPHRRRGAPARGSLLGARAREDPRPVVEFRDYAWLGKGNLTERTPTIWDDDLDPRAPGPDATRAATAPKGSSCSPGPRRARVPSSTPGSPTSRRRCSTCSASRSRPSLEGRLLTEALEPALLDERPPEFADVERSRSRRPARTRARAPREVEERLRSLGYLE